MSPPSAGTLKCVACEGAPKPPNVPCAICGASPVDADLREAVARALWEAESLRATGRPRHVEWDGSDPRFYPLADAAIALVVARCAQVLTTVKTDGGWDYAAGWDDALDVADTAIRALAESVE